MAIVTINDSILADIGDALRTHHGETKVVIEEQIVPNIKISKTENAISHTTFSGGYGNSKNIYDVVNIPGATKITVNMSYQSEANFDYVQVASGALASMPSTVTKYANKTLSQIELEFDNTDTITFYFHSDGGTDSYLGYYAECTGYDAENNVVTTIKEVEVEKPNTYKVSDFSTAIANISGGVGDIKYTQAILTTMGNGVIGPFNIYDYVDDFDKILGLVVRISTDYSNRNNTQTYLKGMKTWDNQPAIDGFGGTVKAIQTDNSITATTDLNETASITSGWYGLALLNDGQLAWAYYNSGSNYQCITYASTTSWTAAYARIELIYV